MAERRAAKTTVDPVRPEEVEAATVVTGGKTHAERVREEMLSIRARNEARRTVAAEEAARNWAPPWLGQSSLLSDQLKLPREVPRYLVDRLMGWNHNVVLAAQHGTGKTTFGLNMVQSLVDGLPFLGREVTPFDGRVAWVNGEMDQWDWLDYARPLKIKAKERVSALHLRDGRLPIMDDHAAELLVKWLVDQEVRVLVVDSWRRLCAWNGVDENVNAEVEPLTARIDQIKKEANVQAFLALAHTGRAKVEEGEERVRGATALDDWVDARWVMVKQPPKEGDARFFWAEKRQVEMPETKLEFDRARYRISLGSGDRRTAGSETLKLSVSLTLKAAGSDGMLTGAIATALGVNKKTGPVTAALNSLAAEGAVKKEPAPRNGTRWTWIEG